MEITSKTYLSLYRFRASIVLGIIGTALFFYGIAAVVFYILKKNNKVYLNGLNIFSMRQISSKFNTNFISMTIICLMLFVTIGTLSTGLTVKNSLEDNLVNQTPFDASVQSFDKEGNIISAIDTLKKAGYDVENTSKYVIVNQYKHNTNSKDLLSKYAVTDNDKQIINLKIFEKLSLFKLSEYNEMRKLKGEEAINLKSDEVLIASNYEPLKKILKDYLEKENSIKIGEKELKIKEKEIKTEAVSTSPTSDIMFSFIVPDDIVNGLSISDQVLDLNFTANNKDKNKNELTTILSNFTFGTGDSKNADYIMYGQTREMAYDQSRGLSAIILFIAVYMGIVFLLASAAVLALQQLSQCNESMERYKSLRKIGATKNMINKSILKQVGIFFTLPLALAIVHSYVGVKVVNNYIVALGSGNQLKSILVTALIMVIVYGGYLYATYVAYRNIANNEYK